MDNRPDTWPQYKNELLPHILFKIAEQYHDLTYAEYFIEGGDLSKSYRKMTYLDLANAVTSMAWWIETHVGKPQESNGSETLAYFGPNDLRFGILTLASMMTGYKVMFPSPRYSAEAITHLLTHVSAQNLLLSDPAFPLAQEILTLRPMHTFVIPPLDHLLSSTPNPYPYTKTFAQNAHEPFVALHTSGTTGFPKPIIWTHDWAASYTAGVTLPTPHGHQGLQDLYFGPKKRLLYLFPPFHASGVIGQVIFALCLGTTCIYPPGTASPGETVNVGVRIAEYLASAEGGRKTDAIAFPPPHAEYLAVNASLLERLGAHVRVATWCGGDITGGAGKAISRKMRLVTSLASTELGMWAAISHGETWEEDVGGEEGWHYVRFHPGLNMKFDVVGGYGEGDVYECVVVRNDVKKDSRGLESGERHSGEKEPWIQPIFKIQHDKTEIRLGDLFVQHPQHASIWKHFGRADDLLTFITGEKFHPAEAERRIVGLGCVEEVLIVGTKRPRAALIVRLKDGGNVDDVWGELQEINKMSPADARVGRDMILVVDEAFEKTAKGSVRRSAVVEKYERKLDQLYEKGSL